MVAKNQEKFVNDTSSRRGCL